MNAVLSPIPTMTLVNEGKPPATFATVYVTLTKHEHIRLVMQANRWRSLHSRATQRLHSQELRHERELREFKKQAEQHEAAMRTDLELAQVKIRELQKRLFGRKSERTKGGSELQTAALHTKAPRRSSGHRRGVSGHGRLMQPHLAQRVEFVELHAPQCPNCGLGLRKLPGTEGSEVLELEVTAYRRVIRRRRYQTVCNCGCMLGIVSRSPWRG